MVRIAAIVFGQANACIVLTCLSAIALSLACNDGRQPTTRAVSGQRTTVTTGSTVAPTLGAIHSLTQTPTPMPAPTSRPTPTHSPTDKPTPAPVPTATPTLTPTLVPTATPTPTPAPTALPMPTSALAPMATPMPSPTASTIPKPTPTPQAAWSRNPDGYVTWSIGDKVSADIETEARSVILAMHEYLVDLDFPPIGHQVTIFLYHDLASLAAEFKEATGRGLAEGGAGPSFAEGKRVIVSGGDWILLNASADAYQEYSSGTRKRILGTNLFAVYQRAVSGLSLAPSRHEVPPIGPYWLSRGAAEFLTFEALEASDPESCDVTRGRFARFSGTVDTPLSDAETRAGFESMRSAYQHSFLAVELLESQASEGALGAYFTSLRLGTTWREAFQTAFGTTVEEFYQLFEEHRAAGFPNPNAPAPSATMPRAPDYVKWHVGPNVPPEDVEPFVKGARLMHEYVTSLGLPEIGQDIRFHLFHKVDDLAPVYYASRGLKPRCYRGWWFSQGRATSVGPAGIFMTTYDRDADSLMKVVAHELFNAYQYGLSELPVSGGSGDEVPKAGPRWLAEGVAEYLAYRTVSAGGIIDFAAERSARFVEKVRHIDEPLSDMETQTGFSGVGVSKYKYSLLAAELLASRTGERALIHYYTLTQPGTTWQGAFESAFGMIVEEFYELFEAHRAAGFPELDVPK